MPRSTVDNGRVCPWCGTPGHVRRSHRNCGSRIQRTERESAQQTSSSDVPVVTCRSCHRPGHSRRSHHECPMNVSRRRESDVSNVNNDTTDTPDTTASNVDTAPNTNAESNAETTPANNPTPICPFCNRPGHSRRSHFNCARNVSIVNGDHYSARNPDRPEGVRNEIGEMSIVCSSCGAFMWLDERKTTSRATNPSFQMCCSNGKAILRPLGTIPTAIADLLRGNSWEAKEFKQNIRSYNSALSFTSMNANLDRSVANNISGAYAFRIHGIVHHLMSSSLFPSDDTSSATAPHPKFAQIYIFDTDNELRNRMNVAGNSEVDQNTMATLQRVMHDINPFVSQFKTMKELAEEQPEGIQDVRMVFKSQGTPDPRRYNDPTASEIGVLIVGGADNPDMESSNRDIVVRLKGPDDSLIRINEIHQHYDPLHYVLMFPAGDPGWYCDIKSYNPEAMSTDDGDSNSENDDSDVTIMQYYSSRLMTRQGADANLPKNQQVGLHSFGKLFHQYIVDMFAKMEQQRLNFIRYNQKSLRAAVYNGLRDAIHLDDHDMSSIGKRVILPSTFIGGPRFMAQLYQDAMALVRRFGKPDLFITFTCNPAWDEITRELLQGQTANDRPDLSARVFNLKLRALLDDIIKTKVFGKVVAYVYSIEFQKRGLPHCHMLFILDHPDKPATAEDVDKILHAEIPDPVTHPLAHNTVTTCMIHGPCGLLNPDSRCMKNGKCTKNYPHAFNDTTVFDPSDKQHSALSYRRRNIPGRTILRNSGTITVDNRWVVPHNLFLATKYNAHINVEVCTQINSVKYLYKYVFKGHDKAQVYMLNGQQENQDEIKNFLDARYVSASEACWRLFSFPMHKEFPSCQRLDIHLENERLIYFDEDDNPQEVLSREIPESTLTAWFNYNRHNPDDAEAKDILYPDFCEKYTFHKSNRPRVWKKRAGGFRSTIGRIHAVSPKDIEKFHLRMLLYKIKGATCFADLKVHNGQTYPTFQATARAMGLLTDDNEWSATMTEATLSQPPRSLRRLFCILLAFCQISDPYQLWLDFKNQLSEDYLYNEQQKAAANGTAIPQAITETMYGHCLLDLNEILLDHRYDLRNMEEFKDVFPAEHTRSDGGADGSNSLERMHSLLRREALQAADPDALTFNESQSVEYIHYDLHSVHTSSSYHILI